MKFHDDKALNEYLKKYASFYIAGIFIFLCVCYSKAIYGALIFFALGLWAIIYFNVKIKKLFKYFQEMSTVDQSRKYNKFQFFKTNDYSANCVLARVDINNHQRKSSLQQIARNRYFFRRIHQQKAKELFFYMELISWIFPFWTFLIVVIINILLVK